MRKALLCSLTFVAISSGAAAAEPADLARFRDKVQPFFAAHCVKCHGAEKPQGKFTITTLEGDLLKGQGLDQWLAVGERLKAGDMPPAKEKQPDPAAIEVVTEWIDREMAKAGKNGVVKAGNLRTGNHIPHGMLFGPNAGKIDLENPPRIWRISPYIYDEIAKQFKGIQLAQPYALPPGDRFKDQADGGAIDESTTAQIMRNAETIADEQLGLTVRKTGNKPPHRDLAPLLKPGVTPAEIATAVKYQYELALKRQPKAEETERFVALYGKALKAGGPESAARVLLVAVLMQPETSYRSELGIGAADKKMLAPRELAFALAYALTDKAPDGELLKAADTGKLASKEDVLLQVNRLLNDTKVDKPRIMRFFREYFGYAAAIDVFKDQIGFPGHDARALVEDTDQLIAHIVAKDQDVFAQLLTTNQSYVAYKKADGAKKKVEDEIKKYEELKVKDPKKAATKPVPGGLERTTAGAYNQKEYTPAAQQPLTLPATERAGILTQPSWLVAYSDNTENHAIRRGKWVRERLLGGTVPDLPINVDAQLPEAPHQTLRQRMEVTKEAYCWQCHQKMNPLGLMFEQFDHFGRARQTETVTVANAEPDPKTKVVPTKDVAVDSTGVIDGTGDPAVDGTYSSAIDMIRKLAKTDRARQVFVRHAFRYWMGRDENLGDAKTLMEADAAYVKSGGSMKALIASLLTSDSFLIRTAPE